jgi:hypothetical protein
MLYILTGFKYVLGERMSDYFSFEFTPKKIERKIK